MKKPSALFILAIFIAIPLILLLTNSLNELINDGSKVMANDNVEKQQVTDSIRMTVILERMYVDGEISQETLTEEVWSVEDFWAKYEQWQLIQIDKDKMVFRQYMDDISPLLKTNGYFGITDEGVLTIFNGRPQNSNIIQSFFQIDLGRLESNKCEELKKGIPIKTKEHYVEVLETFKTYSKIKKQAKEL